MSFDIIDEVRKRLQFKPLSKVNPNTQEPEIFGDNIQSDHLKLKSVVVPTTLVGMYKHSRNVEDAATLFSAQSDSDPAGFLFGEHKSDVIQQVAENARITEEEATTEISDAVKATKDVVKEHVPDMDANKISNLFTDQRTVILKHLPAQLNLGGIMNDSAVDDRTNKMEGPASGLMHTIEKIFSSTK